MTPEEHQALLEGTEERADPLMEAFAEMAKRMALEYGLGHDYTPKTVEQMAQFKPHTWVLAAMHYAWIDGIKAAQFAPHPEQIYKVTRNV